MAYNVDRAIKAHKRLREKNRSLAGRNMNNDKKLVHYYGKYYYHSDMIELLQQEKSKVSKQKKRSVFLQAKDRSRKDWDF